MGMDALRLAPLLVFMVLGGQLSLIDLRSHRLPNRIVAICTTGILALQIVYCLFVGSVSELSQAGLAAGKIFAAYVALYILSRGQLGMGDVKFAIPVGLIIGWFEPDAWFASLLVTFLLAGVIALIGLFSRKLDRKSHIPLGPFMYLGSILTLAIGLVLGQ
jgi:leader peptidase (prepilin peptidase)/N-methyltransferase